MVRRRDSDTPVLVIIPEEEFGGQTITVTPEKEIPSGDKPKGPPSGEHENRAEPIAVSTSSSPSSIESNPISPSSNGASSTSAPNNYDNEYCENGIYKVYFKSMEERNYFLGKLRKITGQGSEDSSKLMNEYLFNRSPKATTKRSTFLLLFFRKLLIQT